MSEAMWIALIGGPLTALASALLTYLFSPERRQRTTLGDARKRALTGSWRGTLNQPADVEGLSGTSEVGLELKAGMRTVKGDGRIRFEFEGVAREAEFVIRGGFVFDDFFRLEYANKKESVVQFGGGVLELNPEANQLRGFVVGYGSLRKRIIVAELILAKVS